MNRQEMTVKLTRIVNKAECIRSQALDKENSWPYRKSIIGTKSEIVTSLSELEKSIREIKTEIDA